MAQKKILLIGERSSSSNGYAYADSFYDILTSLGHCVESFDSTQTPPWMRGSRVFDLSGIEQKIFNYWSNAQLVRVAEEIKPDICFVIKGHTLSPQTLQHLKKKTHARLVLLYPDNPFMFLNGNSNARVVEGLCEYDVVLSWARVLQPVFTSLGVVHSCYFPFGYDERFFSEKADVEPVVDVSFVGTADDERAVLLEKIIRAAPDISIGIWGNRWSDYCAIKPVLKKYYQGPAVYKEAMVKLLHQSRITLNPVRLQNHTSHNMRSLEAAAAGAFQLATWTQEHANFLFKENESITLYATFDELIEKIYTFKDRPDHRMQRALCAKEAAKKYTLQHMLKKFLENDLCFCSTLV